MKKKLFTVLFVLLAVVLLTGCGKKEEQKPEEPVVGGWELNKEVKATTLMMEEEDVFKKATANYTDYTLEPIGYLGSQVVAGTNHMFLCKATKDGEVTFKVIVVYEDLSGKAEIKEVRDFKVEDFAGTDMGGNNEEVTGGWAASSQCGESSLTEEEREIALPEEVKTEIDTGINNKIKSNTKASATDIILPIIGISSPFKPRA